MMSIALKPAVYRCLILSYASSTFVARQCATQSEMICGCGWSHTLNTFSWLTYPNPLCVAWILFRAWRISPSAVKTTASTPSGTYGTFSDSMTFIKRSNTSWSLSRVNRTIAHRDWMGSMIFSLALHARANRVVLLYSSIVRRMACCAADVMESASSSRTILCLPGGRVTFFCANILILFLTTSMPRSSEAFSSRTASLYAGPRRVCAKHKMLVVLPIPGGPVKMRLGMFPVLAMAPNLSTAS